MPTFVRSSICLFRKNHVDNRTRVMMKFRQRVAWLMIVIYLGGTFAFVYYIFEINEHYNEFAIDHIQRFHTDKNDKGETVTENRSFLLSLWSHFIDLPLSVWMLILLFPYFQIFLMILAFTRAEPKMHIAFIWPGLIYLKYQELFKKKKTAVMPLDSAQVNMKIMNGHAVLHT